MRLSSFASVCDMVLVEPSNCSESLSILVSSESPLAREVCPAQVCAAQVGVRQIRADKSGFRQIRVPKIRADQRLQREILPAQILPAEVRRLRQTFP